MDAAWKTELDAIVGARHGGAAGPLVARLEALDARHPNVAEIQYQLAWSLGAVGRHAEARGHYERALALGLPPNDHAGALVGLGSSLLALGEPGAAVETFKGARLLFPDLRELDVFHAVALRADGRSDDAAQILLEVLLETSEDPGIVAYQRALRHLAAHTGRSS